MALPACHKFDIPNEKHSIGPRWTVYVKELENMFIGYKVETDKRKKALLLYFTGHDVYQSYDTLNLSHSETNYAETKAELLKYFQPKKNVEFEKFEFRKITQKQNESIESICDKTKTNIRTL